MSLSDVERHPDWSRRLAEISTVHQSAPPPEWGKSDCLMVVGEAILAVAKENPFEKFRHKYKTEKAAAKLMLKHGCSNVQEVFEIFLGLTESSRLQARRGDVGIVMIQDQPHAGYVTNDGLSVRQPHGMVTFPLTEMVKAYRIGK